MRNNLYRATAWEYFPGNKFQEKLLEIKDDGER